MSMKYNNAKVISHPRAGSHYFAKLLNDNFFHRGNYLNLYAGHSDSHIVHLKSPSTAVFYIHRNNIDTLKSMFVMRDRLGLKAKNYLDFVSRNLKDMDSRDIVSNAIYNSGNREEDIIEVDHYLGQFNICVEEYLNKHKDFWLNIREPNFMSISYDALRYDFQNTMKSVADFLGSTEYLFVKDSQRIGWYNKAEGNKIFT